MPIYEVWHSYPLTEAQQADLAQRITAIHSTLFTVPASLIHVHFTDYAATEHFMGGKRLTGTVNMVITHTRAGPLRPQDQWESLCLQMEAAWNACVGEPAAQGALHAQFTGAFIRGVQTASYEHGFLYPQVGGDGASMRDNLAKCQVLADGRDMIFQNMLAEVRGREESVCA